MHRPSLLRPAAVACCAAAAAVPAVPAPASAATISPQAELRAPRTFPVDLPGGFRQGAPIPRGWVLVRRSMELAAGEREATVTFACPRRTRIRTLALNDPSDLGFLVPTDQRGYRARGRIRLTVFSSPQARREGRPARGRGYVLCRPVG